MKLLDKLRSVFWKKQETYMGFTREQLLAFLPEERRKDLRIDDDIKWIWDLVASHLVSGIDMPKCLLYPFSPCSKFYAEISRAQQRLVPMPRKWKMVDQYDGLVVVHKIVVARSLEAARKEMRK